jgi:hypothetical protein
MLTVSTGGAVAVFLAAAEEKLIGVPRLVGVFVVSPSEGNALGSRANSFFGAFFLAGCGSSVGALIDGFLLRCAGGT